MGIHAHRSLSVLIAAAAIGSTALADYGFKVDGNGTAIKIWWTDDRGNRMGDPIYEGTLQDGERVERSTKSPLVFDHSLKEVGAFASGANDLFWGNMPLQSVLLDNNVSFPSLLDQSAQGGFMHVYYIVNGAQYVSGGGQYHQGQVFNQFLPDGTCPALPGYTIGWSNDPNMTIEQAFDIDVNTGKVIFQGATPWNQSMGPLTTSVRMIADPTTCRADFNGDGFLTGDDFDEFTALFEEGCD